MMIQFFLPMVPPTVTHQEKQVAVVSGKPRFYEPAELKAARVKLRDALAPFRPGEPMKGGVGLYVKWCFPRGRHPDGSYRITKPDTDNLQKLLKDVMTGLGFWEDDARVAFELVEKFWAEVPGIFIRVETLP
ncbi:RusA family crossover junction endodeoxyribonuclease [Pseudoflavonifractor sp. MSJ-30]|uniref:RusA family crossover junction endodeoxyribonuclease n=1 Tax=Pseudoflavonifractor sp. MSJ-30 TaxID=2841525 RepID=UPI001C113985|nr:RusA family crossover junction endodeoxyribonuclease [Pseudoflavonifractor sp. MSJ-30]MBU5453328.1 RusA family crossover junction endodeoxyribonuclease [Pseudoflavonifractor sp. MSJ-30]